MKSIKSALLAATVLVTTTVAFALPDLSWDLTDSFGVNSLDPGQVIAGNTPNVFDYKFDLPNTESGPLSGTFDTVISSDGLTAWVTWSPTGSVSIDEVMVKAAASYILWDTAGVDWSIYNGFYVTQNAIQQGGGPNPAFNAISHIQVNVGGSNPIPDSGGTALLIGLGVVGLGLIVLGRSIIKS